MKFDTLKVQTTQMLDKQEVVTFYQSLLQQQSDNHSNIITLLLGLTTILVGSSVLWNFVVSKNQIKNEINLLSENLKGEISKSISEIIEKRFNEIDIELKETLKTNEAHLARLYAISSGKDGFLSSAANWWIIAIRIYKELNDDFTLRLCVDCLIKDLNKPDWPIEKSDRFDVARAIATIEESVPDILSSEKELIVERLSIKSK